MSIIGGPNSYKRNKIKDLITYVKDSGGVFTGHLSSYSPLVDKFHDKSSIILAANNYRKNFISTIKPLPDDFNFVRNSIATRINKNGFIEEMSNNVPLIDYKNKYSSILGENVNTNYILQSSNMNDVYWNFSTSVNSTQYLKPDPLNGHNATLLTYTGNSPSFGLDSFSFEENKKYVISCFIKNNGSNNNVGFELGTSSNLSFDININNTSDFNILGNWYVSHKLEEYPNNWYRLSVEILTSQIATTTILFKVINATVGDSIILYGLSLCDNYGSFIPTSGSIVKREGDYMYMENVPNLIGQTSGNIILQVDFGDEPFDLVINELEYTTQGEKFVRFRYTENIQELYIENTLDELLIHPPKQTLTGEFDWTGMNNVEIDGSAFTNARLKLFCLYTDILFITLNGDNPQVIVLGNSYNELGATTNNGSEVIIDSSNVNTNVIGTYSVTYNSTDSLGNQAIEVVRSVNVVNNL